MFIVTEYAALKLLIRKSVLVNQCFKSKVLIELSSINVLVEPATFKPAG